MIKPSMDRLPVPEPEFRTHPGEFLKCEFLDELKMSPETFAEHIGVLPQVVRDLINGRTAITTELALRLERALRMPSQFWLDAQHAYDDTAEIKRLRATGDIKAIEAVTELITHE